MPEYYYIVIKHQKKNFTKRDTLKSSRVHMHIELIERLFERYTQRFPNQALDIDNMIDNIVDSGFLEKEREK